MITIGYRIDYLISYPAPDGNDRTGFFSIEPNRTEPEKMFYRTEPNRISVIEPNRTQTFHRVTYYSLFLLNSISAEDETIKSLSDHVTYTGALGACDSHGSRGHGNYKCEGTWGKKLQGHVTLMRSLSLFSLPSLGHTLEFQLAIT
eukprot:sb/3473861/